ncbi:acetate and sugar kinases/Hsc70/actin family protein [Legionella drancourtii]|uniref:Ectonucleoside triphosphate diphosphohydrolase I n=1 Tax=Legionella drancourtii LLAP12 TaxID=658187 RepID=G9EQV5_9GAMM|nr:multidrug DMT transporter permease [Legionella drancourtii]EHL30326.1 ectonucleoside triphosphate diphosphohydrolase I [Legionella drancourtii LLAP12]
MVRLLIFISCLFLITGTGYVKTTSCTEHQCIAVIDAGSTGSRLHVFSYDMDETNTPINIDEIWLKKIQPAFASLETNQNTLDAYMAILFSGAPAQKMPVYFYATAGMRLVPQAKQKIYYQNLKNWFDQQSQWQLRDAKTITGDDEALYDWLSVNYHLGTLKSASQQPIGVLDIGGASTQIAFPLQNNATPNLSKSTLIELTLYGQQINLFVYSFLGLGQNEMTHQLLDSTSCFSNNYPLPNGEAGQGNAPDCADEIAALINGVHKANNVVQPILANNPVTSWYAIGGIANLAESKPFQFPKSQLTTQDFLQQANNLACHQQWDELSHQYPNNEYLDAYCLLPAFYYALMVNGYGFSPNQKVNYVPSAENLDWTMGVVLHH